ncbi:SpoIIE family protein phosphatase [Geodermatophilus sp. SYSU D00815]
MTGVDVGGRDPRLELSRLLEEDPADLYENAPCGYLSALPDGTIVKVNRTFCAWTGRTAREVLGSRFQDLLSIGGQVFHETHLAPLLRMQGAVREIALDVVRVDGSALPCLLNAVEVRDASGAPLLVRATLFEATARRRYERELLAAQRAAEESEARSRTLQAVVSDLAAATTVVDVAAVIVDHGRHALHAPGAALLLLDEAAAEPGEEPALRLVRADGLTRSLLEELRAAARGRLALELAGGVRAVPVDARLRELQPLVAAEMAAAGLTDLVVVPVSAQGRRLGVLLLGLGSGGDGLLSLDEPATGVHRPLPAADVDLLRTLGRQAGQALERARLREEATRAAERATFLLEAARLLAGAADVTDVVDRLAGLAVQRLADLCLIDLATDNGVTRVAARHGDPGRQPLVEELRTRHLPGPERPHPATEAMRRQRTQWIPELTDEDLGRITDDEHHLAVVRRLGIRSIVSVPLVAEGRALGALTLGADRDRSGFTAADVEVAEQLALQVALVVDRAQRYEVDVATSHTLQANLLPPPPPAVEGLAVAVRYLPATRGVDIGGDFYDVVVLPGDVVALAVGDVVGHDIAAAATMGQLHSVYRALLADRPSPSAVIDRLQAGWSLLGLQRMATALFGTLDPATGRLRIASAGHLAPVLVTDGHAELLPVRPARLLGAPPAPAPAAEWAGVLPPGATLVLYTDGLVESRDADLDAGLDRLLQVAARAGAGDPDEVCDRLLAELTGPFRADDIALLALTRLPG